MNIIVSACLLGISCKYNGGSNYRPALDHLKEKHNLIPVCPESYGGLPTPRNPAEIRGDKVFLSDGLDVTEEFLKGAKKMMQIADYFDCDIAILKENSPSCGNGRIYDGTFTGTLTDGNGIFVQMLKEKGVKIFGESDIDEILKL